MSNFYSENGVTVLGSRLRQISERLTQNNRTIFKAEGIDMEPRWFPILTTLAQRGRLRAGELARHIRQSHAATSQVVARLTHLELIISRPDPEDGRSYILELTPKGRRMASAAGRLCVDVSLAAASLVADTGHDLMSILEALDLALSESDLVDRLTTVRGGRPIIVDYAPKYAAAFRDLNYAWINQYFEVEVTDIAQLDNAEETILWPGGAIFIALVSGLPVGACALERLATGRYELSKMAVDPSAQGKGIGYLLGEAVIRRARQLGGETLELESNTILAPAIHLYRKLGFKQIPVGDSPYSRCNIRMTMDLQR